MSEPTISFLTTVYRTEEYLPSMIESVRAQTSHDWELVVVDNGRSAAVADIVRSYAYDRRIRLLRQENRGYRGGVAAAASAATGLYLSVLDSDDRIMPEFVATITDFLRQYPEVDAVGCDAVQFDESEQVQLSASYLDSVGVRWQPCRAMGKLTLKDALAGAIPYYTGAVRRQRWHEVGGYSAADDDVDESVMIWLDLVQQYDVRLIATPLGWYRIRHDSLSREPAKVEAFEQALIAAFTRTAQSAGSDDDRRAVHATVSRLRFHQEMRRARWAFLGGDTPAARRHARRAYAQRPGVRAASVVVALALFPTVLHRMYPLKQQAAAAWLRGRERLAGAGRAFAAGRPRKRTAGAGVSV